MATSLLPPQVSASDQNLRPRKHSVQPQPQQPEANKPKEPNDFLYAFYRYTSAIISTIRNSINFADNFKHNADLCEGVGLQALSDTSIITSFLGVLAKIMEWFEKHAPKKQRLEKELAAINTQLQENAQIKDEQLKKTTQIENDRLMKAKATIEAELYKLEQKRWWLWNATLYFIAYLARGALMLATTLGAAAVLTVIGGFVSFGASIFYASFNLYNTVVAYMEALKDQANRPAAERQSAISLLLYDTKNRRSYLAEICGCTSILLSGLITLSLMGILAFPPTAIIAFGAVTLAFSTAYFGFWAYGRYSAKQSDEQATKAEDEKKEVSTSNTDTDTLKLSASLSRDNNENSKNIKDTTPLLRPESLTSVPENSTGSQSQDQSAPPMPRNPDSTMWAPLRANADSSTDNASRLAQQQQQQPPHVKCN